MTRKPHRFEHIPYEHDRYPGQRNERRLAAVVNDFPDSEYICEQTNAMEDELAKIDFHVFRKGSHGEKSGPDYPIQLKCHLLREEGVGLIQKLHFIQQGIILIEGITDQLQRAADTSGRLLDADAILVVYDDFKKQLEAFAPLLSKHREGSDISFEEVQAAQEEYESNPIGSEEDITRMKQQFPTRSFDPA